MRAASSPTFDSSQKEFLKAHGFDVDAQAKSASGGLQPKAISHESKAYVLNHSWNLPHTPHKPVVLLRNTVNLGPGCHGNGATGHDPADLHDIATVMQGGVPGSTIYPGAGGVSGWNQGMAQGMGGVSPYGASFGGLPGSNPFWTNPAMGLGTGFVPGTMEIGADTLPTWAHSTPMREVLYASSHGTGTVLSNQNNAVVMGKLLDDQMLPWNWHDQCWNDRVETCDDSIAIIHQYIAKDITKLNEIHQSDLTKPLSLLQMLHPSQNQRLVIPTLIVMILTDTPVILDGITVPYHYYLAYEIILGLGFVADASRDKVTITTESKKVGIQHLLKTAASSNIMKYAAELGLHRLYESLNAGLGNPLKTSVDKDFLQTMLRASRFQPFTLAITLHNAPTNSELRKDLATKCTIEGISQSKVKYECDKLYMAISSSMAMEPLADGRKDICLSTAEPMIEIMRTGFLDSKGGELVHLYEKIMLARAFLKLIFDMPFVTTICPDCEKIANATTSGVANAMLTCYCSPRSKYRIEN